ncbi:MAG: electron transport complex subunit RsxC [Firmicutes bacterium]|nr:electron transport complex subunit RsxC [Bacillota bacterium]
MYYTKYELKNEEELRSVLQGIDNIFIVSCNKCFKEYSTVSEPEADAVAALAAAAGKTVTGSAKLDFLCNRVQTERKLASCIPTGTENVLVISCGIGVQTIADMQALPTFTATNSLNYIGHHGMALTKKTCGACAQCYLNLTGGICPIVDCSKSLLNGPCGGAKSGKCEVDPNKDCVWGKIYARLKKQGRMEEYLAQGVQTRDYGAVNVEQVKAYVAENRAKRYEGFYGGVHPAEHKDYTEALPLQAFPEPDTVILPLAMHIGAPANPVVKAGDCVKVGQIIGEQVGFVGAPVHSSVSGTVVEVAPHTHPNRGPGVLSVVIRSDGRNTLDESVKPNKPLEELTPDEIIDIVKQKGIVGMGGATFPTYVKLKPGKPIDAVLINGSECEPYLTADHRMMLEYADEIVYGLRAMMKAVSAPEGVILIEDNKPDAIAVMEKAVEPYSNIRVCAAKTQYPEGAEKMLIKKVMGRQVPSGKLPADVGCVVSNASTAKAISDAIQKGMPLIERAVTVTGEYIRKPGNYMVKLGTSVQSLIDYCGGITGEDVTLKMGGPMMGAPISDANVPILKGSNGVIAIAADHTAPQECIKCGRCVDVCPMELEPLNFAKYTDLGDAQTLLKLNIMDCFSCKCCEYVCSSKIPLVAKIAAGKGLVAPLLKKK